jgi:uncharacterized membrane protein YqaE (UPF0057 family)
MAVTAADPIKIILAILLPPVRTFLEVGLTGHFWLNILLTLLGYIPGIIHALYVILNIEKSATTGSMSGVRQSSWVPIENCQAERLNQTN